MSYDDLIAQIQPLYAFEDAEKLDKICQLLENTSAELRGKANPDLQLSASALVFVGERLIFIEHPYQKEWLLPAGHVEIGEQPLQTAVREFHEETGFSVSTDGKLVDVNLIQIPFNAIKQEKVHLHIDFRYLLTKLSAAQDEAELPLSALTEAEAPAEFKKYYHYK